MDYLPGPVATCPTCNKDLTSLGARNLIPPFWSRTPRFFAYPFNLSTLIYIGTLSLLSSALFFLSFLGFLIHFALFMVFLRYAYAVLAHTARGHLDPPRIDFSMINEDLDLPFKQIGVYVFFGLMAFTLFKFFGGLVASVYMFVMMFCIPATAMVIAVDNDFKRAINPVVLLSIVRRVGWPYLALLAFLIILWGGADIVMDLIGAPHSFRAALFIYSLLSMYFTVVMFHMMGYVIYQYHEEFGYSVDVDPEERFDHALSAGVRQPPGAGDIDVLLKEGRVEAAITELQNKIALNPRDAFLRELLQKLVLAGHDKAAAVTNGAELVKLFLAEGNVHKAAMVFAQCYRLDAAFNPVPPDHVLPIASELARLREYRAALGIVNAFAKNYPGHCDIPAIYLLAARVLCEGFRKDREAEKLLLRLGKTYSGHELAPKINEYLATVRKLLAPSQASS